MQNHDPDLRFEHSREGLSKKFFYLTQSWLSLEERPRIWVTGCGRWLGRYLLHLLTGVIDFAEIVAIDAQRPSYLDFQRYSRVQFQAFDKWDKDIPSLLSALPPQLIFHADYVWNIHAKKVSKIYEVNVSRTESICRESSRQGIRRVVLFSDALVYGPGDSAALEDSPLSPNSFLGKSFKDAEEIASTFHHPSQTQVYHLRVAPVYGPLIPTGLMLVAKLMADGILLGPPEDRHRKISFVSGYDLALSALLIALAPNPGHRVFNIAGGEMEISAVLQKMSLCLPKEKIFGFQARLAGILKIGYQDPIGLPDRLMQFLGRFTEEATDFLNQLSFEKKIPFFTQTLVDYFLQMRSLPNRRLHNTLGWVPSGDLSSLEEALQYAIQSGWGLEQKKVREELLEAMPLLDGVTRIIQELFEYSPHCEKGDLFLKIPMLDFEMDIKSLWILVERAWSFFWLSLMKGNRGISTMMSDLPQWLGSVGEGIMTLVRYEHGRARRMFPESKQDQIKWLTTQIGGLNRQKIRFYATVAVLSEIIRQANRVLTQYSPLVALLPEKKYGIFITSDVGDIGVILKVKGERMSVSFPRTQVDEISRALNFAGRLSEFKKNAHLHVAFGLKMESLLLDLSSGYPLEKISRHFGKDYLLSDFSEHYLLIAQAMKKSQVDTYLFLDARERVQFGIRMQNRKMEILSESSLEMVNLLLTRIEDQSEVLRLLNKTGKDQVAFFKIKTIRRILGGMIAPSHIQKLIIKLLYRGVRFQKNMSESEEEEISRK